MESTLSHVVQDILASYDRVGGMNNADANNLPSKRAIGGICEDMLQILFPGFHDEEPIHKKSLPVLTRHRVSSVMERLEEQVQQSMHLCDAKRLGLSMPSLLDFFQSLPEVRELLNSDIEAAYRGDPAAMNREEVILSYPFIEAIAIQRMAHRLHLAGVPIIPRMMTEWAHGRTGIDIHPGRPSARIFLLITEPGSSSGDEHYRGPRETVPGRRPYWALAIGRANAERPSPAPDNRGPRDDLRRHHDHGRRNRRRGTQHDRSQRLSHA
jgi:Serine acetyltransferase